MKLIYDLELRRLVVSAGSTAVLRGVVAKLRDVVTVQVEFWRGGSKVAITGTDLDLGVKDELGGTVLGLADTWSKDGDDVYSALLNLNTQEAIDAVGAESSRKCVAELTFDEGAGALSSQTLDFLLEADVLNGTEGTPLELPDAEGWLDVRALRVDKAQGLSEAQMAQARANLGLPAGKSELAGVGAPGVADDEVAGFSVGSLWFDTVAKEWWRCVSAAAGAAEWEETTLEPGELHAVAVSGDYDDLSDAPFVWNNPWSFYDAQSNVDMGSYNLSFNGGSGAFSYNTGSYRLELSTDLSVGPFGSFECGYVNGTGMNLDVSNGSISDGSFSTAFDVSNRILMDSAAIWSLDFQSRVMLDSGSNQAADWGNKYLYSTTNYGNYSVAWDSGDLVDAVSFSTSLNWFDRHLLDSSYVNVFDWEDKTFNNARSIAAIADPSGGATIDAECRAKLIEIRNALRDWGLIGS